METPVFGHAAVAAPHQLACETGRRILALGGNALEAMIGMGATIGVVYPHMNSLGGDGFWLVTDTRRRVRFIEACGPAGAEATIAAYRGLGYDRIPARGALAALTVPGAVGGWQVAHDMAKAFGGQLPLDILLEDALRHARDGVPVSPSQARASPREYDGLKAAPGFADAFMKDGKPLPVGETMKQPALAGVIEQLAHAGLDDFYRGDVGREIAVDLDRAGSFIAREDLERYRARVREPLGFRIEGATLFNGPPPTQGLSALVIMGLFERLGVKRAGGFEHVHGLVEAIKRAIAVRDRVIADPAIMTVDPAAFLTPAFLDREAAGISMTQAGGTSLPGPDGDTVWMGAIDRDGIAVSYIQSVFWDYGSGTVLPRTGLLLQNRGMSFSLDPKAVSPLAPGRLPFHTLSPATALFDDGRIMPYGTMGGDAQPQILAQTFTRFRFGAGLADALDAPRFILGRDAEGKRPILHMENRFDETLVKALERAGHPVEVADASYADSFGHSGALIRHPRDGRIEAAHDPRADGGALGF